MAPAHWRLSPASPAGGGGMNGYSRNKQVAQQLLNEFIREKEKEACGMIPPPALRDGAAKSMSDHLADWVADQQTRKAGRMFGYKVKPTRMYVYTVEKRMSKLIEACGWLLPKDVTADSFTA